MKIQIKYFAVLKEQAQKSQENLDFDGMTPRELWKSLVDRYGFDLDIEDIRVAINNDFVTFDTAIKENDLVVFIPPVAGG